MKILVLFLILALLLIIPFAIAEECEYQEIHECREVSEEMHAFNGQVDTDCVERGVYNICTAFNHLGTDGLCYIDENSTAVCSCTADVSLFCSTDDLAVVASNADCTTKNELCTDSFYCSENEEAPFNPECVFSTSPPDGGSGGSGGGSSGGGTSSGSGADDFPTTDEDRIKEPEETIADIIEDFTSNFSENISDPENPTLMIAIVIIVIIAAIAGTVYYFKKHKKRKYKGY
ncbi:MAG: hypothetical protein KKB03_03810 [Nanoarchaeota archaeon]|nr:hypothetical protein [Nanoarchaeota archaeon]MBU1135283.1 hypothetical protein [Nanoarchaeota archaeon]MBU2520340.1 hypothetical protein [Nanoarchaeota archaeon]